MPFYEYEGKHYEIDADPTEAKQKILAHLGKVAVAPTEKANEGFMNIGEGAAFGNPNIARQMNRAKTREHETTPIESMAAGFANRAISQPVIGATQLLTGGRVGGDLARRNEQQSTEYQEANPVAYVTGAVGGELAKAYLTSKLPVINEYGLARQGAITGATSGLLTPDLTGKTGSEFYANQVENAGTGGVIGALTGGVIKGAMDIPQVVRGARYARSGYGESAFEPIAPNLMEKAVESGAVSPYRAHLMMKQGEELGLRAPASPDVGPIQPGATVPAAAGINPDKYTQALTEQMVRDFKNKGAIANLIDYAPTITGALHGIPLPPISGVKNAIGTAIEQAATKRVKPIAPQIAQTESGVITPSGVIPNVTAEATPGGYKMTSNNSSLFDFGKPKGTTTLNTGENILGEAEQRAPYVIQNELTRPLGPSGMANMPAIEQKVEQEIEKLPIKGNWQHHIDTLKAEGVSAEAAESSVIQARANEIVKDLKEKGFEITPEVRKSAKETAAKERKSATLEESNRKRAEYEKTPEYRAEQKAEKLKSIVKEIDRSSYVDAEATAKRLAKENPDKTVEEIADEYRALQTKTNEPQIKPQSREEAQRIVEMIMKKKGMTNKVEPIAPTQLEKVEPTVLQTGKNVEVRGATEEDLKPKTGINSLAELRNKLKANPENKPSTETTELSAEDLRSMAEYEAGMKGKMIEQGHLAPSENERSIINVERIRNLAAKAKSDIAAKRLNDEADRIEREIIEYGEGTIGTGKNVRQVESLKTKKTIEKEKSEPTLVTQDDVQRAKNKVNKAKTTEAAEKAEAEYQKLFKLYKEQLGNKK